MGIEKEDAYVELILNRLQRRFDPMTYRARNASQSGELDADGGDGDLLGLLT